MNKKRLLLIEDDRWLAESYALGLADAYDISIVGNSAEAMDSIDRLAFDLIIADVMLEHGLVIDLLHELQSHSDTMGTPIILCTSLASSIDPNDVAAYGVVKVLDKATLTLNDLRVAAQQALNLRSD